MKKREKIVKKLVNRIAKRIGLSGWGVTVEWDDDPESDFQGMAEAVYGMSRGIVTLSKTTDFELIRATLIHEMLHLRLWKTVSGVERLKPVVEKHAFKLWRESWMENHECEIDSLAIALAAAFDDSDLAGEW